MQQPVPAPDLDLLRPRLAQLITSLSTFTSHLLHTYHSTPPSNSTIPPTLPFPDLITRYSLLISQFNSFISLISSQSDLERERDRPLLSDSNNKRRRIEEKDLKRDKWSSTVIVPRNSVDESKDWIVGLLLRTKQTPEVESNQRELVDSLPDPFKSTLDSPTSSSDSDSTTTFSSLLSQHTKLVQTAFDRVNAAKEFAGGPEGGGEEWDWKGRVKLDEEEEEEEEEGIEVDDQKEEKGKEEEGERSWTELETLTYLRTGRKPLL